MVWIILVKSFNSHLSTRWTLVCSSVDVSVMLETAGVLEQFTTLITWISSCSSTRVQCLAHTIWTRDINKVINLPAELSLPDKSAADETGCCKFPTTMLLKWLSLSSWSEIKQELAENGSQACHRDMIKIFQIFSCWQLLCSDELKMMMSTLSIKNFLSNQNIIESVMS